MDEQTIKDAARYRWLRDKGFRNHFMDSPSMSIGKGPYIIIEMPSCNRFNGVVVHSEYADKLIDAEILRDEMK